jgi:hypothetical protein
MSGRLVAHSGAEYIDREGLRTLETPPATDTSPVKVAKALIYQHM